MRRPAPQPESAAVVKKMRERAARDRRRLRRRLRKKNAAGNSKARTMPVERKRLLKGVGGASCALVSMRTVTVMGTVLPSGGVEGVTVQVALTGAPAQE